MCKCEILRLVLKEESKFIGSFLHPAEDLLHGVLGFVCLGCRLRCPLAQLHPLVSSWLGTFAAASRVGHECVSAADDTVSVCACSMSIVLQKTYLQSWFGFFFYISVFLRR